MDLNALLRNAVALGASDIHLKLGQPPILRRDGSLGPLDGAPPLTEADLDGVLELSPRSPAASCAGFEETGDLDIAYQSDDLPRFRVNAFRQRGATSFAFRVIPKNVPSFEQLGLPPGVQRLAEEHRGLVLVTGATGSGKTTTLAAMIDYINRTRRQHIVTIEDPIEILHPDHGCIVNQREVGLDTDRLHAGAAARAPPGPRRDPDRRAARRRDGPDRAPGGRVGPPRPLDAAHGRRRRDDRPHRRVLPGREAADDPLDPGRRPHAASSASASCRASTAAASRRSR